MTNISLKKLILKASVVEQEKYQKLIEERLNIVKSSLIKKIENGEKFHSLKVNNINYKTKPIQPMPNDLVFRGMKVKNLSEDEKYLALEIFGYHLSNEAHTYLPISVDYSQKIDLLLDNVQFFVTDKIKKIHKEFSENGIIKKLTNIAINTILNKYGWKEALNKIQSHLGTLTNSGYHSFSVPNMPIEIVSVGIALTLPVLASPFIIEQIKKIRQESTDKKDGNEFYMAVEAVKQINLNII